MARFGIHTKQNWRPNRSSRVAWATYQHPRLAAQYPRLAAVRICCGRRCEVDAINGAIPGLGKPLGVAMPVNETVVGIIRARERRMLASQSLK